MLDLRQCEALMKKNITPMYITTIKMRTEKVIQSKLKELQHLWTREQHHSRTKLNAKIKTLRWVLEFDNIL